MKNFKDAYETMIQLGLDPAVDAPVDMDDKSFYARLSLCFSIHHAKQRIIESTNDSLVELDIKFLKYINAQYGKLSDVELYRTILDSHKAFEYCRKPWSGAVSL